MGMWSAIALIVIACVIGETFRKKYEMKGGAIDDERLAELEAKIDKLDGVIVTNRPDTRTAQYQSVLKHGDALLNRIQRLARVVSV